MYGTVLGQSYGVPYRTVGQDRQCIVVYGIVYGMGTVLGQSYGVPYRTVGQDRQCIVVWCPI